MAEEQVVEKEITTPPGEGESPVEAGIDEAGVTAAPPEEKEDAFEDFEPEKKGRVEKRIHTLIKRAKQAEEEANRIKEEQALLAQERDNWRNETLRLSGGTQKPQEIQVDTSDLPVPKRDDFEDEDDYQDARAQRAATIAYRREHAREEQARTISSRTQRQTEVDSWAAKGREKYPDFELARRMPEQGGPTVTPAMGAAIMASEFGHDVLYELGKNPAESLRIAYLHPIEQGMEIQKLAKRLAKPKPKTETEAPVANTTMGERGSVVTKEWKLTDPDIPFAEYEKIRMKQMRDRQTGA